MGLEGLVAKRGDSPYVAGRSPDWRKLSALKTDDFVVVGYLSPARGGVGLKALLVAQFQDDELVYTGRVGSGLDHETREALAARLRKLRCKRPAVAIDKPPAGAIWVRPDAVVEVRYKEFTAAGQLRQGVLLRIRDDKTPADCIHPVNRHRLAEPAVIEGSDPAPRFIAINTDKVFWPGEGLTKGQMLHHYEAIAKWMLPYLEDRPIVLKRYPDGIEGNSFFQHEAPQYLPTWIRTEVVRKKDEKKRYILIDDRDSLLYIANLGTIPIHAFSARVQSIDTPDWCILDIDPKDAPFTDVIAVARELHRICDRCGLPNYLKTSGGSGLHILIPLGGQVDHEQSKALAELLARVCVTRLPETATIQRQVELRRGRVYIDYLQNGFGKTIAAPFCVRPRPGAPVSMPLRWDELKASTRPGDYHIRNATRRMAALKSDPMAGVLTGRPDLHKALRLVGEMLTM
jgi:bifunctional non-homologous end joining protein LigD